MEFSWRYNGKWCHCYVGSLSIGDYGDYAPNSDKYGQYCVRLYTFDGRKLLLDVGSAAAAIEKLTEHRDRFLYWMELAQTPMK